MSLVCNMIGIGISRVDTAYLIKHIDKIIIEKERTNLISYVNADCVNKFFKDNVYKQVLEDFDLVYPDGMSIVWISRLYGNPLPERVNLGDFLPDLCKLCSDKEYRIFLLGGKNGVAEEAANKLKKDFPNLKIVGTHSGFFDDNANKNLINRINDSGTDILLVGMGVPKQEKWIYKNRKRLNVSVCWGVGGLFDYYSGSIKRAPVWMRRSGLEWFFRLIIEPKRLWRRYLIGNILFLSRALMPFIVDMFILLSSWVGAYYLRIIMQPFLFKPTTSIGNYLFVLALLLGAWPFIASFSGIYSSESRSVYLENIKALIRGLSAAFIFNIIVSFYFRELGIARSFFIIWFVLSLILFSFSRKVFRHLNFWFMREKPIVKGRVIIIGTDENALFLSRMMQMPDINYEFVGFVSISNEGNANINILGNVTELDNIIKSNNIDEVILADERMPLSEKFNLIVEKARETGNTAKFNVVSKDLERFTGKFLLSELFNIPMLNIKAKEPEMFYDFCKYLFDKLIAAAIFFITLPLWAVIAITIKLDSKGPVFFVQDRVGKKGEIFKFLKFRTMYRDASPNENSPANNYDKRITVVGRFLRRWSIDELPQVINVLKDEMSIIGPRPEMKFIVEQYEPWQKERLKVKPGITGLWQVAGRKKMPLHKNIEYDMYYINNRSMSLDLAIILKTIPTVIGGRGAY